MLVLNLFSSILNEGWVEFGEIFCSMDGLSGVESLEVEFFSFFANGSRIEPNEPFSLSLELLPSSFGIEVQMCEGVLGLVQILLRVLVVLGLVEEEPVPSVSSPPPVHVEKLQRVVTGSHCEPRSRRHVRVVVLELVLLPDLLVYQKVTHATVFSFFSHEILNEEPSDGSFYFVVPVSSGFEQHDLVRVETLSHHGFEEITPPHFPV